MLPYVFFEVGSLGFWFLLCFASILLVACVEYASPGWAVLTVVAVLALFPRATTLDWFHDLRDHPSLVVILIAGYLVAGTGWSVVKWWFYVRNRAKRYLAKVAVYKTSHKLPPEQVLTDSQVYEALGYSAGEPDLGKKPSPDGEKGRILTWMIWWPWSALWTAIDEPIKKAFKFIFNEIKALYQKISDSAYKNIDPPKSG
jgi:hypothetical protein